MEVQYIGWGDVEWIQLAHDQWRALVNKVMKLKAPLEELLGSQGLCWMNVSLQ
jgi:hypothetical protein